jgi:geranylgeranylglycerol-phosphate geranylgeranyltransferase
MSIKEYLKLKKLAAIFLIIRPVNALIGAVSVALGVVLAEPAAWTIQATLAVISSTLILAGANVINDFFDFEIDRINRPRRVLPSGRMTPREALALAIFLFATGNFFAIFASIPLAVLAITNTLLLVWYSADLKKRPASGNVVVSFASGVALVYGAMAGGSWKAGVVPGVFALLFHFGREVIKDIEDRLGDAHGQARTLPIVHGVTFARVVAGGALVLLLAATVVPWALDLYNDAYLFIILAGVYPVVIYALRQMWKDPSIASMRRLSAILKADMLVGLAAIYFGR